MGVSTIQKTEVLKTKAPKEQYEARMASEIAKEFIQANDKNEAEQCVFVLQKLDDLTDHGEFKVIESILKSMPYESLSSSMVTMIIRYTGGLADRIDASVWSSALEKVKSIIIKRHGTKEAKEILIGL